MKPLLKLAVEVHNPTEEMLDLMKDLSCIKINDNQYVFVYHDQDQDIYDELTDKALDEDNLDTSVTFGIFNENDNQYYNSDALTKCIKEKLQIDDEKIGIEAISMLQIDEIEDVVDKEKKRIEYEFYGSLVQPQDDNDKSKTSDEKEELETDKKVESTSQDDVQEISEKVDSETPENSSKEENHQLEKPEEKEISDEEMNDNSINENPLLTLAIKRLEEACPARIPVYDDYTSEQIRPVLAKSATVVERLMQKGEQKIYQRLLQKQPIFEKAFEEKFDNNQQKHDETVKTILENEKVELTNTKENYDKKYLEGRNNFVESQKPALIAKYDSEHKADFDMNLKHEQDKIHAETQQKIDEENNNFDSFKAAEEDKFLENQFNQVDIDDIVKEINKGVEGEVTKINAAASQFADQTEIVAKEALDERDKWKRKYEEAEKVSKTLNETFEPRVATEVKERVAEETSDIKKRLNASIGRETQAREEIQKMSQKNAADVEAQAHKHNAEMRKLRKEDEEDKKLALQKQEDSYTEKIDNMTKKHQEEISSKDDKISQLEQKIADKDKEISDTKKSNDELRLDLQKQQQLPIVSEDKNITGKTTKSNWKNWAMGILALATVSSGCYACYTAGKSNASSTQAPVATTSTVSSSSEKITSSVTQAPYTKGQKVEYHDPKTNKDYQVTINNVSGNTSTGTYTDDKGVTHTVTYTNE